ncbi:MAG TPA: Lrp/AsnC family transcriptional regulator [Caulobacteraceae bacterium]|jgi:Lrp/AsnC family leucine-responsive transcriptional regulator|nr:Lrp/AsnC family transcriptional regulator [Caulobacteraceae bacterium]
MPELSEVDLRILRALQADGRLTNVELAERVGLSPSPCLRRVKQLEARGLIKGYVALLDRRAIGLGVMAFVEVQVERNSETAAEAFTAALKREGAVVACYAMTGPYDYLLQVVTPTLDDYADFAMQRLLKMPGVKDVRSSFALEAAKESTALPLEHLGRRG